MTETTPAVPRCAEWLIGLPLARADYDAVLGDLHEEFTTSILPVRGARAARWWYRRQVARSLAPLCLRAWQRASLGRASAACAWAGTLSVLPAALLVTLRSFVLQQVPLKTTAEASLSFSVALVVVVAGATALGLATAVSFLNSGDRSPRG